MSSTEIYGAPYDIKPPFITGNDDLERKKSRIDQIMTSVTEKGSCGEQIKHGLKMTAVALVIVGLVVGLVGLLVYLGNLQLGLEGCGMMSVTTGLYTAIGGLGLSFLLVVLLGVAVAIERLRNAKDTGESCFPCCNKQEIEMINQQADLEEIET